MILQQGIGDTFTTPLVDYPFFAWNTPNVQGGFILKNMLSKYTIISKNEGMLR
jgi:hypothetical protein